ncbi:hypothetical protein M3P05_08365 [Sansalvadorimonas sp. 2012CJ34-2]|uniref:Glycine cleavage system transcriptional repressor n=1 Tax=Parendozoicomonas callyspongiae TaxID=2942213 RepID=A0ABT0PF54_9GAMM|nr:ACT domain-containing protein [Sansalvadorimonas sp. 2012CJ34-2]MCL6269950.1 hypothetical protein [Sansalvadorimonas sp. 2012CJ34-2]
MTNNLLLTVTGPDLPGMEDVLARTVSQHKARSLSSHMAHMGGRFASIMFISVSPEELKGLTSDLTSMKNNGVKVQFDRMDPAALPDHESHLLMNLIADEAPELVTDVSRLLGEQHIRISEIHTDTIPAPYTGEHLQSIQAHLYAPDGTDVDTVRERIESLSPELILDISPG